MDKCEKLLQKARRSPGGLSFREICTLAECHGFLFRRQDGTSHRVYTHPKIPHTLGGFQNFQNDKGKAKDYQVRQLLRAIEYLEGD
jgi:hypothetical protein